MAKKLFFVLLFVTTMILCSFSASAFIWVGHIKNSTGGYVYNANVSVERYDPAVFESVNQTFSVLTNQSGYFELNVTEATNFLYKPVIRVYSSSNVLEVGPLLPEFPLQVYTRGLNQSTIYTQEAVTINITTYVNTTNNITLYSGFLLDTKLGYPIATFSNVNQSLVYSPASRNYTLTIWGTATPPKTFTINNISAYSSPKRIDFIENQSVSFYRLSGYASVTENSTPLVNFTNYYLYDFVNNGVFLGSSFLMVGEGDNMDSATGFYNITVPSGSPYLFAVYANDTKYYAGFLNVTMTQDSEINMTLRTLAGAYHEDSSIVNTSKTTILLMDASTGQPTTGGGFIEVSTTYAGIPIKWFGQVSGNSFNLSLWNSTTATILAFNSNYAPRKYRANPAALNAANATITIGLLTMNVTDDTGINIDLNMVFYTSNSTCDVPSPPAGCLVTNFSSDEDFNPMQAMLGGSISLRFVQDNGVEIHYSNVDMLASGPPDVMLTTSGTNTTSGDALESAWKFGSKGPDVYDFILVGMPYDESEMDESGEINISLSLLYDEDFNVVWNTSSDGTNVTLSEYADYNSAWFTSAGIKCTAEADLSEGQNCSLDATNNIVWVRWPHFSAVGPTIKGNSVSAATTTTTTTTATGSSGAVSGTTTKNPSITYLFDSITADKEESINVNREAIDVTGVSFILKNDVADAEVHIEAVPEGDLRVEKLSVPVYQYIQIKKTGIADEDVKGVTINFRVLKSWLEENNIDKDSVVLMAYNGQEWERAVSTTRETGSAITGAVVGASGRPLKASLRKVWGWVRFPFRWLIGLITGYAVYAPSDYEEYTAKLGILNYVAITGEPEAAEAPPTEEKPAAAETMDNTSLEEPAMEEKPKSKISWLTYLIMLVVIAAATGAAVYYRRQKKYDSFADSLLKSHKPEVVIKVKPKKGRKKKP